MSRETRLLLATITISVIVLALLSRLRFPETSPIMEAPPPPLERLAASATYNELAAIVAAVQRKIAPNLVVLRTAAQTDAPPRGLTQVLEAPPPEETIRHVPALVVSPGTAIAAIGPSARIVEVVRNDATPATADVIATDQARGLSLIRVAPATPDGLSQLTLSELNSPAYVVVVEGTRAGLTFRPVFVGSNDRFSDARWERPLLAVSSIPLTSPGALFFSLEGQFLGCAIVEDGALAIAAARDVAASVDRLSKGALRAPVDLGVYVQPLTPGIAAATRAQQGVVVAEVSSTGPAHGILQPADVVTRLEDRPITYPDEFLLRLSEAQASPITLGLIRSGQPMTVSIPIPEKVAPEPAPNTTGGILLRQMPRIGSVITGVTRDGRGQKAGLKVGDLILQAGDAQAPSPMQVDALLRKLQSDRYLLLRIRRQGRERVIAFPGSSDPNESH
jgi:hypothetical protein